MTNSLPQRVIDRPRLDLRRLDPRVLQGLPQFLAQEGIEDLLRLPHIDDSPAAFHGSGHMKYPARRDPTAEVQFLYDRVVLRLGHTRPLQQKCDCH